MESFLAEYGLSTDEGVALMCLAEALLRVPDDETVDDLIRDKITPHDWASHVGDSGSILINASTWALMLTGKVLGEDDPGVVNTLQGVVRRLGEPVVRIAVKRAMQELGSQFVLGEDIARATARGDAMVAQGYSYSYDMLGEAARTADDAQRYFDAYCNAITQLADRASTQEIARNPGISVKLSALHPRYESAKATQVVPQLADRLLQLSQMAAQAGLGLNVDAEEAGRLEMSLDIVERILADESIRGWAGFGVVVQAYGKRALPVIDWLHDLATRLDRKIMVRLVKGAYWDSEIKLAQVHGHHGYSVYRRKADTDVSYIACARRLLSMRDRIYPQFATHNAHTLAAVLEMAGDRTDNFEFQRLHGMGEALHDIVLREFGTRCRIYAPVGAHQDLLAYLVRRLLENGANSSFVNQIVDHSVAADEIAADPFTRSSVNNASSGALVPLPDSLYQPWRDNSKGWDLNEPGVLDEIASLRAPFMTHELVPMPDLEVADVATLVQAATEALTEWQKTPANDRADLLNRAADLYEANAGELFALLTREAGKTIGDAVSELREAVDFLRYYASQIAELPTEQHARGVIVCISPWNFPLAIFTGQIAAALVTGNTVIAKPAEQTPLIANRAVQLLHEAGISPQVLQLAVGDGATVGAALTAAPQVGGVCFTGSTQVAKLIEAQLAKTANPDAMLIAETGGLNAMIVDSTALTEQAVRDVINGAFQSAGQRCSALRMLYVQSEKRDVLLEMLKGAMKELKIGDPADFATDIGPVIDADAQTAIGQYCSDARDNGRVVAEVPVPSDGHFAAPTIIAVNGIEDLTREIFGPVLHVATFEASDLDTVISNINASGFGLTFGLHSRIDERVQRVVNSVHAGNVYINRDQIGAVVGSQPFGGHGLSGSGPKAGGPYYLKRFTQGVSARGAGQSADPASDASVALVSGQQINDAFDSLQSSQWPHAENRIGILRSILRGKAPRAMSAAAALSMAAIELPGPTGESNRLTLKPVGNVLCASEDPVVLLAHVVQALRAGNRVVAIGPDANRSLEFLHQVPGVALAAMNGFLDVDSLPDASFDALALDCSNAKAKETTRAIRIVLSESDQLNVREQPVRRIISGHIEPERFVLEYSVCIDTTAAGGNAQLLASQ
jgi:RHH-type proline utilization regulon transcriptional repressor/proline dehydrogenase/delta 1-pyrroline-5-carboxylate dehydrogenase